jgi:hypothetical protein
LRGKAQICFTSKLKDIARLGKRGAEIVAHFTNGSSRIETYFDGLISQAESAWSEIVLIVQELYMAQWLTTGAG